MCYETRGNRPRDTKEVLMKLIKSLAASLAVVTLCSLLFSGCAKPKDYVIEWEDSIVEAGFRAWLGKYEGDVYSSDLDSVVQVSIYGESFYVNEDVRVNFNAITSTSDIESLSDFQHCRSLEKLKIACSNLTALDGIASLVSLNNLTELEVFSNAKLTNVDGVERLSGLKTLDLTNTGVSVLPSLAKLRNLESLCLGFTQLSDLTPIESNAGLKELYLHQTPVENWENVGKLINLEALTVNSRFSDPSLLSALTNLKYLNLSGSDIDDLDGLSNLHNLEILDISHTNVRDLLPLSELPKLQELFAVGVLVVDWSFAEHVEVTK